MQAARFVFVSHETESVSWLLMSRNNRHLGQSGVSFASLAQCRDSAQLLCREADRIDALTTVNNVNWRWVWRCNLDGTAVALSARSYLRQFECEYSLHRFLEALPIAELTMAVRAVRNRRYDRGG
jgi:hypothetical protein